MATTSADPATATARGLALVCAAGIIWGTIGPAVDVVHGRSPLGLLTIGAYRAVAAVLTLGVAVLVTGRLGRCVELVRTHPVRAVTVGTLTAAFQLLFFTAVVDVGVSVATVVCLGCAPVVLIVVDGVLHRHAPARGQVITVATALAGLVLVGSAGDGGHGDRPVLGVAAALGSGAAYAFATRIGGVMTERHDPVAIAGVTMTVAGLVLVAAGLPAALARGQALTTSDPDSWWLIVYLGVMTMALAYVLLFAGLRTTPGGTAVIATLLEPVTAVIIAVLFLGERLTPAGALGSLLIVAAIGSIGSSGRAYSSPPGLVIPD